jgi:hypothetical protein
MQKLKAQCKWTIGYVDPTKEHIELRYGDAHSSPYESWRPVALIGKPKNCNFPVTWLMERDNAENTAMLDEARKELDFYLIEVGGPDPWGYAMYHCNTSANMYSMVHWSYYAHGCKGERYSSKVVKLPKSEAEQLSKRRKRRK